MPPRVFPSGAPPLELAVELDRASPRPLAAQLAAELRDAATRGQLRRGDRLPSTRALARHLDVSRTVTAAAYEQLHAEGWIAGRHGSGTYVTAAPPGVSGTTRGGEVSERETGTEEGVLLAPGAPWSEGIDRAAWRRAWRAAGDKAPSTLPYRAGVPEYRAAVVEHLLRHRGLVVEGPAENSVLATAGTTSALAELAASVLRPGMSVAIEDPGYQRAVGALRAAGVEVHPVPVDHSGIVVERIPEHVNAVYCSPAHQYPLGGRMPAQRRTALIERARAAGWLIVEDDYDGELRYDVAPLPVLAAMAPDVVVHLGTTSKILTPTLGVGWLLAPEWVTAAVLEYRQRTGTRPAPAGQWLLTEFAANGDLGRHLRRLRREFSRRRELIVAAFDRAGFELFGDRAGAHVVLPLSDGEAERRVIGDLGRRGVFVDGLRRHHLAQQQWYGLALGYAACGERELRSTLPLLVEEIAGG
ncbi:GntR family transcriptional regulator / MocR family aminotransferase [Actinopolyspora xinjiangensis]|uniref:GntR family transcriptional regulator / MocR family aminotransferase n=1 Tax=Actinopolyspora xinjiangensis TaxID=405564 RepID=A0A1H0T3H0_9ACTN|nr:PLP-dependent aminotransferase family protein [Actinopolyspora xinjiangensis]SDP48331.1 GntR family transcriptional regulator / MocR family aminotransferase [Actinopolyspora xinjiangensis]